MDEVKEGKATYSSPVLMTQQFKFCPNPFRVDMYKGCDFGCKYCFANSSLATHHDGFAEADIRQVERLFERAFGTDLTDSNLSIELLRHRVPLHCGGMSDPFQGRERTMGLTYKLLQVTNKYDYPIMFSTKTAEIPEHYFEEVLRPDIHAFQSSIMGWTDEYIKKYETNTPTASKRLEFGKNLRARGFWWAIRIQPLIDLNEAIQLINNAGTTPNYITIEHLKIPIDNVEIRELFADEYNSNKFLKSKNNFRNVEMIPAIKRENALKIIEVAGKYGVPVGVGDNDLHHLSQSRCCCGVDTINSNFDGYLKYNLTYMLTDPTHEEKFGGLWCPQSNCRECFNSCVVNASGYVDGKHFIGFKEKVDEYIINYPELVQGDNKRSIEHQLYGVAKKSLF